VPVRSRVPILSVLLALAVAAAVAQTGSDYERARRKLDTIEQNRAAPGATFVFTRREIEAWARVEIPKIVPDGFRNPTVQLGKGVATGSALLDFAKIRHARGYESNWLIDRLISGERPVSATVRITSSNGHCTVELLRVAISGVVPPKNVLDFLVNTFFLSLYPDAAIDRPFELDDRVDRIVVRPAAVYVTIRSAPHRAAR
jgi:hypothetical protein